MIRILIVDDHAVVREGLRQIVTKQANMTVAGEASTVQEALELVRKQEWDIVVLDIGMPGRSGIELLKELKQERPKLPVLILSIYPEDQYAVRALRAGAAGYMTKETASEDLVDAIRKVCSRGRYISPSLAERLALELDPESERPPHEKLSDREYEVFLKIASGRSVSNIAEELSLSVKTIRTYRARILEKTNMKANAELTHDAIRNHLVDL